MKSTNIPVSGVVMKKSDFQQFNGQDGKPAYIAYKGHIYNVSKSNHDINKTYQRRMP